MKNKWGSMIAKCEPSKVTGFYAVNGWLAGGFRWSSMIIVYIYQLCFWAFFFFYDCVVCFRTLWWCDGRFCSAKHTLRFILFSALETLSWMGRIGKKENNEDLTPAAVKITHQEDMDPGHKCRFTLKESLPSKMHFSDSACDAITHK